MKIAIVKPDHLGDFVLALPALRSLSDRYSDLVLYVATSVRWLAEKLAPELELRSLDAPHLIRDSSHAARQRFQEQVAELARYDVVIFLRNDHVFNAQALGLRVPNAVFIEDRHDRHAAALDRAAVADFVTPYDIDEMFFGDAPPAWPDAPRKVGLSIGAGVVNKKWSPLHWTQLAQQLREAGVESRILCGPREQDEARLIAGAAGLSATRDVIVGGRDLSAFDDAVADLDLVVAADGGTSHLVGRTRPVLSVFGSSPFRRYCPIGSHNRVVTLALPCSPCPGFDVKLVNACLTHECLYGITPAHVMAAISAEAGAPGTVTTLTDGGPWPAQLHYGLSAA